MKRNRRRIIVGREDKSALNTTIHSFKGLENKVIILTDIENLFDKKLMYVGLSRATTLLYVIETEEANKQYTELFIKRRLHND